MPNNRNKEESTCFKGCPLFGGFISDTYVSCICKSDDPNDVEWNHPKAVVADVVYGRCSTQEAITRFPNLARLASAA